MAEKRQLLSAIVRNRPGVLAQISGLFAARGFNVDSLTVGETEDPELSRMTIVSRGEEATAEQLRKQLSRVVDTVKVFEYEPVDCVERELLLVKLHVPPPRRPEVVGVCDVFRGRVVDVATNEMTVELVGTPDKTQAFIELMRPYGIKEVARTGSLAMARGPNVGGPRKRNSR